MERIIGVHSDLKPESLTITPTIVDVVSNIQRKSETDQMDHERVHEFYEYDIDRYSTVEWEDLLSTRKLRKIELSKAILEKYLAGHPIEFNGKYYTVTQDKQTQLLGTLNMYKEVQTTNAERMEQGLNPIPFQLTWNATGEPCEEWNYEDLSVLLMNIYAYVKALVTEQQYIEVKINEATDRIELDAVKIDYENLPYTTT